ncbi:MAG: bifunctional adenosylcobinamide kinase/adenosylcobinamide-phosphate guanylyltransferase [Thainema sp.]
MTEPSTISSTILVTGPARSGKSEWAERLATQPHLPVIYIATAQTDPTDPEWQQRIEAHRQRRSQTWQTVEAPIDLVKTLQTQTFVSSPSSPRCLLIDSLGTWLANCLEQADAEWHQTQQDLLHTVQQIRQQSRHHLIFVAEETGWSVVPAYPLGRLFRDRMGMLTRQLGAIADAVYLVTGGYALDLAQLGQPIDSGLSD